MNVPLVLDLHNYFYLHVINNIKICIFKKNNSYKSFKLDIRIKYLKYKFYNKNYNNNNNNKNNK